VTATKSESAASKRRPPAARLLRRLPPQWKRYAFFGIGIPLVLISAMMA